MCGIAGIFSYHYAANPVDRDELLRIREHMRARGPDGAGNWFSQDGRLGLAHRRLAIIDLTDRAAQPFVSADGRYVLVFNGEIYNYKALRAGLEADGVRFRSDSDTEVILQLFMREGVAMLPKLRGMFGIAIWDGYERRLLLARDPYGIKPLYYADDGWTVRFASQVKALLAGGRVSRNLEPAGIAGFYLLGSVPEPLTLYQEIQAVPAGSFLWVDAVGAGEARQFFSIPELWRVAAASKPEGPAPEQVRTALLDSVRHHLMSDVPVGIFLSAGIDSGALTGLMRDAGQGEIQSITLAFDEFTGSANDEAPLAEETSRIYATKHTTRRVGREEFAADIERILDAMDQPSIDGLNTWFVAKAAHEAGLKVALSGLGGDELFGGYPSFRDVPRWVNILRIPSHVPGLGKAVRLAANALGLGTGSPKLPGVLEFGGHYPGAYLLRRGIFMSWELPMLMGKDAAHEGLRRLRLMPLIEEAVTPDPKNPFARVAALEAGLYMRNQLLRDCDWGSMAHSLEVRVPLVDAQLLSRIAPLFSHGGPMGKGLLAGSPAQPLPARVVSRSKTGFGTPVASWLQQQASLESWRKIPALEDPRCPWARRWAHVIGSRFAEVA